MIRSKASISTHNADSSKEINECFLPAKFRDERNQNGELLFTSRESCINSIRGLPVFNIKTNKIEDF